MFQNHKYRLEKGLQTLCREVHKLENWQDLVKSLNDNLRRLKVVYSGSSLLKLEKRGGDLSRRQTSYTLDGLSFREHLKFEGVADIQPFSLEDLPNSFVVNDDTTVGFGNRIPLWLFGFLY